MDKKKLAHILYTELSKIDVYQEALDIVRKNSTGKIWLLGGAVFRTLAHAIYDTPLHIKDWDFLAEDLGVPFICDGWRMGRTSFGHRRFSRDNILVELFPLIGNPLISHRAYPTIQDHLRRVPLTVQSIAYDADDQIIIGEVGIQSVLTKRVDINNPTELLRAAEMWHIEPYEYLRRKAVSLGFQCGPSLTGGNPRA